MGEKVLLKDRPGIEPLYIRECFKEVRASLPAPRLSLRLAFRVAPIGHRVQFYLKDKPLPQVLAGRG
jgi:hypothetical protein